MTVFEDQARDDEILASQAKVRLARDQHLSLGLSRQRDRSLGRAFANKQDFKVTPLSVRQDNRVAGLQGLDRVPVLLLRRDPDLGGRRPATGQDSHGEYRPRPVYSC